MTGVYVLRTYFQPFLANQRSSLHHSTGDYYLPIYGECEGKGFIGLNLTSVLTSPYPGDKAWLCRSLLDSGLHSTNGDEATSTQASHEPGVHRHPGEISDGIDPSAQEVHDFRSVVGVT
jgi:hypothetical protein